MKSKAQIKGHPIHPILVGFPIAFFIGTLLFDILAELNDRPEFGTVGYYLEIAGIVAALVTAIPGFIDFLYTVPSKSSAKKRGAQHGLINVTVVVIFAIAWFYRKGEDAFFGLIIALEALGVIGLVISGWLGGTLVYRNQIGVNPRYANAGKWKEISVRPQQGSVEVADGEELQVSQMKLIRLPDKRIVLGRTENGYVAFDDRCTHRGGSLAGGAMICGTVQCPWHGSQFNVSTGEVKAGPAQESIHTYTVKEVDGKVLLTL